MSLFVLMASLAAAAGPARAPLLDDGTVSPSELAAVERAIDDAMAAAGLDVVHIGAGEVDEECLGDGTCLATVALEAGVTKLLTGRVHRDAATGLVRLELALFDVDRVVQRTVDAAMLPSEPAAGARAAVSELFAVDVDDMDPSRRAGTERAAREPRRPRPEREPRSDDRPRWLGSARVGWSRYQALQFGTADLEIRARVAGGLHAVAGGGLFVARRDLPDGAGGVRRSLDALAPVHAGLVYALNLGAVRPYLGAEAIAAKYHRDLGALAVGGRGRLGVDLMVTDGVGIEVDAAFGVWRGREWEVIAAGLRDVGGLPSVSAGLVWAW